MNENPLPSPQYDPQRPERRSGRARSITSILVVAAIVVAGLATRGWLFRPAADGGTGGDMACDITEPFEDVSISAVSCDVEISVGSGDTCVVEYRGPSRMACTAEVKNGTLQIEEKRIRRLSFWNWFSRKITKLTVFLPQDEYEGLTLETVSGDVKLEDGDLFRDLRIVTTSGDMDLTGAGGGEVALESVSGDVKFRDGNASGLCVGTTSGDVTVAGVDVTGQAELSTTSGDVAVTSVDVTGQAELSTTSGDVALRDADAESLSISTTSGDLRTELRTPKEYVTETTSGEVTVTASQAGAGRCSITTVSGDILCE